MNLFGMGNKPPTAPTSNTPLQQQQSTGEAMPPAKAGEPATPAGGDTQVGAVQEPTNPLDAMDALWQTQESREEAGQASEEITNYLDLQDDMISKAAGGMDVLSAIPAELKSRIEAGDGAAMLEAIELASRQAYSTALKHSTTLANRQLQQNTDTATAQTSNSVREQVNSTLVKQAIGDSTFSHPLQQQELNRVSDQVRKQYPDASPAWVADQAHKYMQQLAASFAPATDVSNPANEAQDINWEEFAGR